MERGLVSRILFPAPASSYTADSFPRVLIWVPKKKGLPMGTGDGAEPATASAATMAAGSDLEAQAPAGDDDSVPCLLLTYPSARFLVLFFHSNAEDLGRCRGFCCYLREQFQVHVLAVEYPGYGICPGVPCGRTVMENALSALHFATDTLRWPLDSIKIFGRSIGTGPAVALASLFTFAGLILVTPFLSVRELFRDRVGPFSALVEEWFSNQEAAPKITSPTMIIHGQRDELIACRHGESLYELLRARKLLVSPPDMEHNTNLLTNLEFFVLPMFQFFALPDYVFHDICVPDWAYDPKGASRRSAPPAESLAAAAGLPKKPALRASSGLGSSIGGVGPKMREPQGDGSAGPKPEAPHNAGSPSRARSAPPGQHANSEAQTEGVAARSRSRQESCSPGGGPRLGCKQVAKPRMPEAREAIRQLEEFAGRMCMEEATSDMLLSNEHQPGEPISDDDAKRKDAARQRRLCAKQRLKMQGVGDAHQDEAVAAPSMRHRALIVEEVEEPSNGHGVVRPLRPQAVPRPIAGSRTSMPPSQAACGDSIWLRWCGAGRPSMMVDLHEADSQPESERVAGTDGPPRGKKAAAPMPSQAPPLEPPPDAPKAANSGSRWTVPPPDRVPFMAACCRALPSEPHSFVGTRGIPSAAMDESIQTCDGTEGRQPLTTEVTFEGAEGRLMSSWRTPMSI